MIYTNPSYETPRRHICLFDQLLLCLSQVCMLGLLTSNDEEEEEEERNISCSQSSFLQRHQSLKDIPTLDMHVNWCPTRPLRQIVIGKKSSSDSGPAEF